MVNLLLIDAKWEGEVKLEEKLKKYFEKNKIKSVALFASVQFTHLNDFIKEIEKLKIKVNTTKAKRTDEEIQVLGCDCYEDSFSEEIIIKSDIVLYVGDGLFHPKALLLSQMKKKEFKPMVVFNPVTNEVIELGKEDIEKQIRQTIRNLKLYLHSDTLGILVTTKPGQQYLLSAKVLKKKLEEKGKKAYIFVDDTVDINLFENYPFIKTWINTSCPRIGTDDIVNTEKALINIREALAPEKTLEELENAWK